ncbi:MAG: hypothetical protein FJX25_09880 [Alphaproteobacteria bacterium]|nr:hypothetical protein [Alphaproteobacteria bacterium]
MSTLAQIAKPVSRKITLDDDREFAVYPLRLGTIAQLLISHPILIGAFKSSDAAQITAAVLHSGQDAVNSLIEAACRLDEGGAEEAGFTAFDEAEILTTCLSATLPKSKERLGKFKAELLALVERLGFEKAEEATPEA